MKVIKSISLVTTIFELIKSIVLGGVLATLGVLLIDSAYLVDSYSDISSKYVGTDDVVGGWEIFYGLMGSSVGIFAVVLVFILISMIIVPFVYSLLLTVSGFKTQRIYNAHENRFMKRIKRESILKIISAVVGEFAMIFLFSTDSIVGFVVSGICVFTFLVEMLLSIVNLTRYKRLCRECFHTERVTD